MVSLQALAITNPRALRRRMTSAGPLDVCLTPILHPRVAGLMASPPNRPLPVRAAGSWNEAETK